MQSTDSEDKSFLGECPVGKLLLKMSVPSILALTVYNSNTIVDTIYISRGVGINAAGGLSVSFPLFIFLSAVSTTLGSGSASVLSRALGRKEYEKADKTAANTFGLFYAVAVCITFFGLLFLKKLLYGMGVTQELFPYAEKYTRIILLGAVTSTAFSSLIRAEGNSMFALYIWLVPMAVNLILDPIMIFGFHLGVSGAAGATVLAQCVSVGMSVYYFFFSGKSALKMKAVHFLPDGMILREITGIGLPSLIQLGSYSVVLIVINRMLKNSGGDMQLNTYGIVNKINTFLIIPVNGIVQGAQPVIGYNYGAGKKDRVGIALKKSIAAAGIYGILVSCIVFLSADGIIHLFTTDSEVQAVGAVVLRITNAGILFSSIQSVETAYFQAAGKKVSALLLSLCTYIFCFIPIAAGLSALYGVNGIWYSFPAASVTSCCISSVFIVYTVRKERHEQEDNTPVAE